MIRVNELNRSQRKKGQKFALLANSFNPAGAYVMVGALMILFAGDVLGLPTSKISAIMSLIPLVSILRLFLLSQLTKVGKVKLLQITSLVQIVIISLLIIIPNDELSYSKYITILISYSLLNQLGSGTAWQPLLRDITTNEDRGRFFSRMRLVFTLINLLVTGITPVIIGESISSLEYKYFLILPLLSKVVMFFMVRNVPEITQKPSNNNKTSIREVLRELKSLKRPLLLIILVQCTFFPLFILYLRQVLNLPSNIVTTTVFIGTLGNATSLLYWGQISDTVGFRNTLTGVHILGFLQIPFLLFIQPITGEIGTSLILSLLFIYSFIDGIVLAGSGIAMTSIQHFYTTKDKSILIFSFFSAITLLINALWVYINGQIITLFNTPISFSFLTSSYLYIDGVKIFMISIVIIVRFTLFFYIKRVPNIKPWFGLTDFFTSLNPTSIRTLIQSSRIHKLDGYGRELMSYSLGRRGNPFSIHSLLSLLKDPSYDVKISAIRELGRSGSTLAGRHLSTMLENTNMSIYHEHIIWALGQLQWDESSDIILNFLSSDRSEKLKAASARSLGRIGTLDAIPQLKLLIKELTPTLHLSSSACWALIKLDMEDSAEVIFNSLPLYKNCNIKYEIMDLLCDKLNISNAWILKYGQDQGGWKALKQYTDDKPIRWRSDNQVLINALFELDYITIQQEYITYINSSDSHLYIELNKVLQKQDEWNPLSLMASAHMLYK